MTAWANRPSEHRPPPRANPAEQVFFWLARSRRHDVPFDIAWDAAVRRIHWPHNRKHREDWKEVIHWARPVYYRAYHREGAAKDPMRELRGDSEAARIDPPAVAA